jgi:aryl-alcohol dehydrogenase-like predicted oxidoreductase
VLANQMKLEAVQKLSALATEAGLTLPHMATAFVRAHPAVTSVLIGPRTMAHLDDLLAGQDVRLSHDVLDAIDEIVPPGTNVNPRDVFFSNPALVDPTARRRS